MSRLFRPAVTYDAAFNYLSPKSYDCYNLERSPESEAATSTEDAGRRLHAALESVGRSVGASRSLNDLLIAVEPLLRETRVIDHPFARVFTLTNSERRR